jgi:hypothetical protein
MSVPPPLLDSRTLQDILTQLRERAALDVPEWTLAPEGDAGTMLQRIFARLLDLASSGSIKYQRKTYWRFSTRWASIFSHRLQPQSR